MSEHHSDYRPITLPRAIPGKQCGVRGQRRSNVRLVDPTRVDHDPPSQPIPRYRGCPPGCRCLKCETEQADRLGHTAECRPFALEASHAPQSKGYRQTIRRTG